VSRTFLMRWRDHIRDSDLSSSAKLVAHTLSTYMDASGHAFPSRETLASGCSLAGRTVYAAINELETAKLLTVHRSRSRRGNRYWATGAEFFGQGTGQSVAGTRQSTHGTRQQLPTKALKAVESGWNSHQQGGTPAPIGVEEIRAQLDRLRGKTHRRDAA
jgi:hypothetical protein